MTPTVLVTVMSSEVRGMVMSAGRRPYSTMIKCRDATKVCWKFCEQLGRPNCIHKDRRDLYEKKTISEKYNGI